MKKWAQEGRWPMQGQRELEVEYFNYSNWCVVRSHHGLNLHFPNGWWCWTSFHVLICHVYMLFTEISVHIFCPFFFSFLSFFLSLSLSLFLSSFLSLLFLAALGLCCYAQAFSSCGELGLFFVAVLRLLLAMASRCGVWALGAQASVVVACGLSCCGSRA